MVSEVVRVGSPESAAGSSGYALSRPRQGRSGSPGWDGSCWRLRPDQRRLLSFSRWSGRRFLPDTAGYTSCPCRSWPCCRFCVSCRWALEGQCARSGDFSQPPRKGRGHTGTRSGSCGYCSARRLSRCFPAWLLLPQRSGAGVRLRWCPSRPAAVLAARSAILRSRFLTSFP